MPLRAGRRLAAFAGLVLAACTPLAVPRSSPTVSPSASAGELHQLEAEDVQTLDPALIDDPVSLAVGAEMLEGLTSLDPSGRPQPGLASSWEVSDRATTYTFHLRDARYQSGAPVRAQDAIADWSRALSPAVNSPLAVFFKPLGASHVGDRLAGLTAPDDRTLRIHLAAPDSELLSLLAYPPYWLFDPASVGPAPSGSGPFRLAEWKPGRDLRFESSPGYWGAAPRITRVRIG